MSAVRRGSILALDGQDDGPSAGLILTNDLWNEKMGGASVVPLFEPFQPEIIDAPLIGGGLPSQLQADLSLVWFSDYEDEDLGEEIGQASAADLAKCAAGLVDLLNLRRLRSHHRAAPPGPAGRYPRWRYTYYLKGAKVAGESKRYLVVSNDHWNAAHDWVLVVRTTSQDKYPLSWFPKILSGNARACCAEVRWVAKTEIDLTRPPTGLTMCTLDEMGAVADAFQETLGI